MEGFLLLIATWACCTLGFGLLALRQERHWRLFRFCRQDRPPMWLAPAGLSLLVAAMLPAIWRDGTAFGLLVWSIMLTLGAVTMVGVILQLGKHR